MTLGNNFVDEIFILADVKHDEEFPLCRRCRLQITNCDGKHTKSFQGRQSDFVRVRRDIKTLMNAIHERLNSAQKNATSASVLSLDKTKIEFTSELAATAMSVYSLLPTMAISSDATPVVLMM